MCITLMACNNKPDPLVLPQGIREVMEAVNTHDIHAWQGNIDGRIPVLMWYRKKNNALSGMVVYTGSKGPQIPIRGVIKDSIYTIRETDATFSLKIVGTSAEGSWISLKTGERFYTSMMYTDTSVHIPDFDTSITKTVMAKAD